MEKEFLAIINSLENFKTIIFNSEVTIYTDNANLLRNTVVNSRVNRWKLRLEEYNYELKHIKGVENGKADKWSRLYYTKQKILH